MEPSSSPAVPADHLASARLVLRPLRWDAVRAIVEDRRLADWAPDYPAGGDVVIARVLQRAGQPRADEPAGPWCHRQVVERASNLVIGGIGFFGPPGDGAVETGAGPSETKACPTPLRRADDRTASHMICVCGGARSSAPPRT
jgi:[ribosomal protein S5]-alanine N-acetyltransferase